MRKDERLLAAVSGSMTVRLLLAAVMAGVAVAPVLAEVQTAARSGNPSAVVETPVPIAPTPTAGPAAPPEGFINLGITPLRAELTMQPGASTTQPVRITNSSTQAVQMRGGVIDWTLAPNGDLVYRKRGEPEPYGCGKWIQVNPVEFSLSGGQTQLVRYTISVPEGTAVSGYHCGIAFDMLPPPRTKLESPMGVVNLVRMLTALYVTVGAPEVQARIKTFELARKSAGQGWEIVTAFENPGKTHYRVGGSAELLSPDGQVLEKFEYTNAPVLPGGSHVERFSLAQELAPGAYRVRAVVDVGAKERLAAETRVIVTSR